MAIEVAGDGAVEIGAVDVDSGGLQAGETSALGSPNEARNPTEITAKAGFTAASISGVVEVALPDGLLLRDPRAAGEGGDAALDGFFGVALHRTELSP